MVHSGSSLGEACIPRLERLPCHKVIDKILDPQPPTVSPTPITRSTLTHKRVQVSRHTCYSMPSPHSNPLEVWPTPAGGRSGPSGGSKLYEAATFIPPLLPYPLTLVFASRNPAFHEQQKTRQRSQAGTETGQRQTDQSISKRVLAPGLPRPCSYRWPHVEVSRQVLCGSRYARHGRSWATTPGCDAY